VNSYVARTRPPLMRVGIGLAPRDREASPLDP
jgi:hypothetical protein